MAGKFYEATWDTQNDFTGWTVVSVSTNITADRVTAPSFPWIGGCGRIRTTWVAGLGTITFSYTPPNQSTPGRKKRISWAMNVRQITMTADIEGPFRITARNNVGAAQGEWIEFITLGASEGGAVAYLFNADTLDTSSEWIDFRRYLNEWLIFDMSVESSGATAPYTITAYCDVWVERNGRLKFVTRMTLPDATGVAYDFDKWYFGWSPINKNVDSFEIWFDELRVEEGGGSVPLPRMPSRAFDAYQAQIRIRKWDRATSTWKSAWDVDPRAIVDLNCSFLAYRVEDRCEIELIDPGRYSSTKAQDVLTDLESNAKPLYRLDVYAPDTTYRDPQFPSDWRNDMIFWSGVLVRREPDIDQSKRGIKLAAIGWTEHLKKFSVAKKQFYKQTISAIMTSLVSGISGWPGTLSLVTRSGGLDTRMTLTSVGWDAASLHEAISNLADQGQFFFGVSVSGYPSFERQSNSEFRLVFFEPHAELDVGPPASIGTGEEVGIYIDPSNDKRVTECSLLVDESNYANRWDVVGAEVFVDLMSVVAGSDATKIYDSFAYDSGKISGLSLWEVTLTGFQIALMDKAYRSGVVVDVTGTGKGANTNGVFMAGTIADIPASYKRLDGDASFLIISIFERASPAVLEMDVGQLPADQVNTALSLLTQAIRYILRPNGVRVQRTIRDAEDDSSTGRESIGQRIENGECRGYQQAGVLALGARYAERRSAERCTLKIAAWTRVPNGSRNQWDNLVGVVFGTERMTLLGTTAQGGDNYKYGDDERPVGGARFFEIRGCDMRFKEGGWEASYTLAAAGRDLVALLLPSPEVTMFDRSDPNRQFRAARRLFTTNPSGAFG